MGRRNQTATRTTTSDAPEFVPDPGDDHHADYTDGREMREPNDGGPLTDEQVAGALGTDDTGGQPPSGAEASAPAKPRRKPRGPNKPKPGLFTVVTEASMPQAQIVALLAARAEELLGKDAAAGMELQVNVGGGWLNISDLPPHGATVRFATKGHK